MNVVSCMVPGVNREFNKLSYGSILLYLSITNSTIREPYVVLPTAQVIAP